MSPPICQVFRHDPLHEQFLATEDNHALLHECQASSLIAKERGVDHELRPPRLRPNPLKGLDALDVGVPEDRGLDLGLALVAGQCSRTYRVVGVDLPNDVARERSRPAQDPTPKDVEVMFLDLEVRCQGQPRPSSNAVEKYSMMPEKAIFIIRVVDDDLDFRNV